MANNAAIPLILSFGVGITIYALSIRKEEPATASTILSIMGATAGLLSISSAISARMSAQKAIKVGKELGVTVNDIINLGNCPNC